METITLFGFRHFIPLWKLGRSRGDSPERKSGGLEMVKLICMTDVNGK